MPAPTSPVSSLLLVGVDHRTAPLDLREKVALADDESADLLVELLAHPEVAEACLLSTCNRTELYLRSGAADPYPLALERLFRSRAPELIEEGRLYVHRGDEAARHLLRVAAGLESMVLGEPEILGQVKQAAALASRVGATGTVLERLLRAAAQAGRRARSESAIGEGAVSLGSVTVDLAANIFRDLTKVSALLLGAGDTARMAAHCLTDAGLREVAVANRSPVRLARLLEAVPSLRTLSWEERLAAARRADLVVVATSAPTPVLTRGELVQTMRRRAGRSLLLVDLAVPRNVDPRAAELGNLFLHTVDSLQILVERNLAQRRQEIWQVERIVDRELAHFSGRAAGVEAEPVVAELQRRAERIRRRELAAARGQFPPETHEPLERLTRSLVRKILHHPSTTLRRHGDDQPAQLELARRLFRLDDDADEDETS
ncbi:MAG: glutamyl-tRNA reductase [Thermoanaerobaculia bacterium]